jgi:hypothetical protein
MRKGRWNHDSCFFSLSFACAAKVWREGGLEQIFIDIDIHNTSTGEKTVQVDWFSEQESRREGGWLALFFSHLTNRMLLVESGTGNRGPVSSSSNVLAVADRVADRLSGARLE